MKNYRAYILSGLLPFGVFLGWVSNQSMPSLRKAITVRILYTSDTQGYFDPCG